MKRLGLALLVLSGCMSDPAPEPSFWVEGAAFNGDFYVDLTVERPDWNGPCGCRLEAWTNGTLLAAWDAGPLSLKADADGQAATWGVVLDGELLSGCTAPVSLEWRLVWSSRTLAASQTAPCLHPRS